LRRRKNSDSETNGQSYFNNEYSSSSFVVHHHDQVANSSAGDPHSFHSSFGGDFAMMSGTSRLPCSRDRTNEFRSAVGSLENGRMMGGGGGGAPVGFRHVQPQQPPQMARRSAEFMTIARSIGGDIASTYTKLEKLTLLARRMTNFDDRPQEIQELTHIIKEDMNMLNRQIGQLQQIAKSQQMSLQASRPSSRGRHQAATHSSSVVVALQSRLANMTNQFKNVLQVRTENLKESRHRQQQFSQDTLTTSMPPSAANGFHSRSLMAAMEDDERAASNGQVAISMDGLQAMQKADHVSESYLQSRADTMQSIESTIVELGGIFQQLAHMIKEQEEIMVRIDSNVEDTAMNVEGGHAEILKYFQSVTSNRWLMVKIFGVLIFFFIFFVVFMA